MVQNCTSNPYYSSRSIYLFGVLQTLCAVNYTWSSKTNSVTDSKTWSNNYFYKLQTIINNINTITYLLMFNQNDYLYRNFELKSAKHWNTHFKNTIITSNKKNKIWLVFQNIIIINVHTTWWNIKKKKWVHTNNHKQQVICNYKKMCSRKDLCSTCGTELHIQLLL